MHEQVYGGERHGGIAFLLSIIPVPRMATLNSRNSILFENRTFSIFRSIRLSKPRFLKLSKTYVIERQKIRSRIL